MADSVRWQCGGWDKLEILNPNEPGPNILRHSGDTLDFTVADAFFDPGFQVEWRGTRRGDSLYMVDSSSDDPHRTYKKLGLSGERSRGWHVDSATAIHIADSVLRAPIDQSPSTVTAFERHSFGYVIQLTRTQAANRREGSRGEAIVGRNGAVKLLRRYK